MSDRLLHAGISFKLFDQRSVAQPLGLAGVLPSLSVEFPDNVDAAEADVGSGVGRIEFNGPAKESDGLVGLSPEMAEGAESKMRRSIVRLARAERREIILCFVCLPGSNKLPYESNTRSPFINNSGTPLKTLLLNK